jgi:hypothetical protein
MTIVLLKYKISEKLTEGKKVFALQTLRGQMKFSLT